MEKEIFNLRYCKDLNEYREQKKLISHKTKEIFEKSLKKCNSSQICLSEIGIDVNIPYYKVGKSGSTIDLLEIEDLELFFFYKNKAKNKTLVDIGSNIGLHSLIWSRYSGYSIGFEPDPNTYENGIKLLEFNNKNPKEFLRNNTRINESENNEYINAAVSKNLEKKVGKFIRFADNPLGNHLEGRKINLYGNFHTIDVNLISTNEIPEKTEFIKLDAEGADLEILDSIIKNKEINFTNLECIFLCDWRDTNSSGMINLALKNNLKLNHGFTNIPVTNPLEMYKEHRHNFACLYFRN